jgi:hypothetical protein
MGVIPMPPATRTISLAWDNVHMPPYGASNQSSGGEPSSSQLAIYLKQMVQGKPEKRDGGPKQMKANTLVQLSSPGA